MSTLEYINCLTCGKLVANIITDNGVCVYCQRRRSS